MLDLNEVSTLLFRLERLACEWTTQNILVFFSVQENCTLDKDDSHGNFNFISYSLIPCVHRVSSTQLTLNNCPQTARKGLVTSSISICKHEMRPAIVSWREYKC